MMGVLYWDHVGYPALDVDVSRPRATSLLQPHVHCSARVVPYIHVHVHVTVIGHFRHPAVCVSNIIPVVPTYIHTDSSRFSKSVTRGCYYWIRYGYYSLQTLGLSSGRKSSLPPKSRSTKAKGQGSSTDPIVLTYVDTPPTTRYISWLHRFIVIALMCLCNLAMFVTNLTV